MAEDALCVWLLSDGRPGHYNQALGVVNALRRLRPLEVERIDLRLRAGLLRSPLRLLLNAGPVPPPAWLRLFHRLRLPARRPDVIVSAGGRTSFANAWLGRRYGVPNLFAGSLRGLTPRLFHTVLTLEPVPGADNNLVLEVPPTRVDPQDLAHRRVVGCGGDTPCRAVLIGGNGAGYRYGRDDWQALARVLAEQAERRGVRWLIATSPRTGAAAQRLLRDRLPETALAAASWHGRGGEGDVLDFLAAADRILVTEDSMTMLAEAVSALKPVYALRPAQAAPDARYRAVLDRWQARGLVARLRIDRLVESPGRLEEAAGPPLARPPVETLAGLLRLRLGW